MPPPANLKASNSCYAKGVIPEGFNPAVAGLHKLLSSKTGFPPIADIRFCKASGVGEFQE